MKRLCILAFCMSALAVAQQPAKAAPTAALRWITNTLANTRATVYTSDRHDTFVRDAYFYTDVRFTDPCHLLYVEHRNVATANRVQHDMARASLDLHDLAAQQTHVVRYSEQHPAPPPLRYTMDGWSVLLSNVSGKPARPIIFDGQLTADRFLSELRTAAEACEVGK